MAATAFDMLVELERLGRGHAGDLPTEEALGDVWAGVGFRLRGWRFVCSMSEVAELLKYPAIAPIPRTKAWVRGMANVRGTLLPIMDLNGFLGDHGPSLTRLSRVLVVPMENAYTGLLVDEVFGVQHFPRESLGEAPGDLDPRYAPFVTGSVEHDGEDWLVFSMQALVEAPQFLMVAS